MTYFIQNLKAKINGSKDGKKNFPENYDERSPYLRKITELGYSTINYINGKWHKADKTFKSNWLRRAGNEYDSGKKLRNAETTYKTASAEYLKLNPDENSLPIKLSRKFRLYYILLPLFVIADIYLTVIVFRIFGESDFLNLIFGLILGIILAVFSHKLGEKLASTGKKFDKIFIVSAVSMLIAVCLAFGILRGLYISNGDIKEFSYILFSVMNLFFLFSAVFYSYKIHKPGLLKLKEAEINLEKSEVKYNNSVKSRLEAVTLREKGHRIYLTRAERVINRVNQLLHIYWQKNIRNRSSQIKGEYKPKMINLTIPDSLASPDWSTKTFNNINNNNGYENTNGHQNKYNETAYTADNIINGS